MFFLVSRTALFKYNWHKNVQMEHNFFFSKKLLVYMFFKLCALYGIRIIPRVTFPRRAVPRRHFPDGQFPE